MKNMKNPVSILIAIIFLLVGGGAGTAITIKVQPDIQRYATVEQVNGTQELLTQKIDNLDASQKVSESSLKESIKDLKESIKELQKQQQELLERVLEGINAGSIVIDNKLVTLFKRVDR